MSVSWQHQGSHTQEGEEEQEQEQLEEWKASIARPAFTAPAQPWRKAVPPGGPGNNGHVRPCPWRTGLDKGIKYHMEGKKRMWRREEGTYRRGRGARKCDFLKFEQTKSTKANIRKIWEDIKNDNRGCCGDIVKVPKVRRREYEKDMWTE